jgi:hypothetical protein
MQGEQPPRAPQHLPDPNNDDEDLRYPDVTIRPALLALAFVATVVGIGLMAQPSSNAQPVLVDLPNDWVEQMSLHMLRKIDAKYLTLVLKPIVDEALEEAVLSGITGFVEGIRKEAEHLRKGPTFCDEIDIHFSNNTNTIAFSVECEFDSEARKAQVVSEQLRRANNIKVSSKRREKPRSR